MDDAVSVRLASACAGSLITSLVSNPFDVIRVRMQQASALQPALKKSPTATTTSSLGEEVRLKPRALGALTAETVSKWPISPALASDAVSKSGVGISVCCKDVFWYPSTLDYCMVSPEANNAHGCLVDAKNASTWSTMRHIVSNEGPVVLWRGLGVQLVQAIPANVIYFTMYEQLRDNLNPFIGMAATPFICGGAARAISSAVVSPLELIKTRLQSIESTAKAKPSTIVMQSVKDMLKTAGYRSLWSGLGLTLWRDVPFSSIYWVIVEGIRTKLFSPARNHTEKFVESLTAGCIGGTVAATLTTPFDVGKTRRQLSHALCSSAHMPMPSFLAHIVRTEGLQALFVGLGPRILKVAPSCGIMITSYELGKRFLSTAQSQ